MNNEKKYLVINNSFYPLNMSYRVYYIKDSESKDHMFYFVMDDTKSLLFCGDCTQYNKGAKGVLENINKQIDNFLDNVGVLGIGPTLDLKYVVAKAIKQNKNFKYEDDHNVRIKALSLVACLLGL